MQFFGVLENEDLSDVIGNAKKAKDLSKKQKVDINYGLKVKSTDGDKGIFILIL